MINEVRDCDEDEVLNITTNGGSLVYDKIGISKHVPVEMHYNPNSIANVLSMSVVAGIPGVRIVMDSEIEKAITVFLDEDQSIKFQECSDGLYYYDTNSFNKNNDSVSDYTDLVSYNFFINSVTNNKKSYSKREVGKANKARRLQHLLCWPSTQNFKHYVKNNMLKNCDIDVDDINRAEAIYGEAPAILQGKMVRPKQVSKRVKFAPLPMDLPDEHRSVTLSVDILFVNKIPFLVCHGGPVNHLYVHRLRNRTKSEIAKKLKIIKSKYSGRGFAINVVHGDNEFNHETIMSVFPSAIIEICGANEHVPVVERSIRTIKDRTRCLCKSAPFTRYTKVMTVHAVLTAVRWINQFPSKGGISDTISPAKLLEGIDSPDLNIKRIAFGTYALVYVGTQNNMNERSLPCIALSQSNLSGGNYFLSLETGKRIHSNSWKELPIDDNVLSMTDKWAEREGQSLLVKGNLLYGYGSSAESDFEEIEDVEMMEASLSANHDMSNSEDEVQRSQDVESDVINVPDGNDDMDGNDIAEDQSMNHDIDNVNLQNDLSGIPAVSDSDESMTSHVSDDSHSKSDDIMTDGDDDFSDSFEGSQQHVSDGSDIEGIFDDDVVQDFSTDDSLPTHPDESLIGRLDDLEQEIRHDIVESQELLQDEDSYGDDIDGLSDESTEEVLEISTRPRRECVGKGVERLQMDTESKAYSTKRSVQLLMQSNSERANSNGNMSYMSRAVGILLTQMSATEGIKKHGEKAIAVLVKEFKQLDEGPMEGKKVVEPLTYNSLTKKEKKEALDAINLIKEKRDGSLKGRSCANGAKQRRFLKGDEVYSSPTVSNESLLTTSVIDAVERRDVATADVPGAYLHAEFPKDKKVILRLTGIFVDIMCRANPEYLKYVAMEKGKKVLYFRVLRALYGCLESALLWYNLYSTTLVEHGFKLNPYDKCVANKDINGKQCTIVFYVDDNKISHVDPDVVTDVIDILRGHFGELTITRGREHNFLGMDLFLVKMEPLR